MKLLHQSLLLCFAIGFFAQVSLGTSLYQKISPERIAELSGFIQDSKALTSEYKAGCIECLESLIGLYNNTPQRGSYQAATQHAGTVISGAMRVGEDSDVSSLVFKVKSKQVWKYTRLNLSRQRLTVQN